MDAGNLFEIVKRNPSDENPYPENLCELTVRTDYYKLQELRKHCPLINLNRVVQNAVNKELNPKFVQYDLKNATVQIKLTDYSGSVEVIVNMDEVYLPESADQYLEQMAKKIQDYLKLGRTE